MLVSLVLIAGTVSAQSKHGIGLHFGGNDYFGPQTGEYLFADKYKIQYNTVTKKYDTASTKGLTWFSLVKFSYYFQINKFLDFNSNLSLGNVDYPTSENDLAFQMGRRYNTKNKHTLEADLDALLKFNILSLEKFIVSPYAFTGLAANAHQIYFGVKMPVGVGFNFEMGKTNDLYVNVESSYRVAITAQRPSSLHHTLGLIYWLGPHYKASAQAAKKISVDTDGDGIIDSVDACPSLAGLVVFSGCPDSDNDGVSDKEDECPLQAGVISLYGCPDSDDDGISDREDKCPYAAGAADKNGCPVADKDGDGFIDDEDSCPELYSKTNMGCPEIPQEIINQVDQWGKAILFETAKAELKKTSYKPLNRIVQVLRENPELYADIQGHTDNVGDAGYNLILSRKRAAIVRNYFISAGILAHRLSTQGLGEEQPITTNETEAGKAQNRRIEIELSSGTP